MQMLALNEHLPNSSAHWPLVDVYAHNCQKAWLKILHHRNFSKNGAWIYLSSLLFQAVLINPVGLNQASLSGTVKTAQALAIPQQRVTLCGSNFRSYCWETGLQTRRAAAEQQHDAPVVRWRWRHHGTETLLTALFYKPAAVISSFTCVSR